MEISCLRLNLIYLSLWKEISDPFFMEAEDHLKTCSDETSVPVVSQEDFKGELFPGPWLPQLKRPYIGTSPFRDEPAS